jgi:hypothetical protein
MDIVSDARLAWVLFATPNFPFRAADAGERGLCRCPTLRGCWKVHGDKCDQNRTDGKVTKAIKEVQIDYILW